MNIHFLHFSTASKGLHNLGPYWTYCSQLGNLHKEIGTHGEFKGHLSCGLVHSKSPLQHCPDIISGYSQTVGNLLNIIGTTIAEHITFYKASLYTRCIFDSPLGSFIGFVIELCQGLLVFTGCHQFSHWIGTNNSLKAIG